MKRITIPNYVPTLTKGVFADIEVTYTREPASLSYSNEQIHIDEIFCNGGNITELLTESSFLDLQKEVSALLAKEALDAQVSAGNWGS